MSSDSEHKFYHHHSSSQENRDFVVKHTPWYFFQCIMCKVEESIVRSNIRKIILQTAVCMISCPHTKEIVEGMQELKSIIDAHSESHGHEAPCVLSVSILSYVPMFCSLDIPFGDRYSEWVPPPNFNLSCTRRVSELLPINTEILHKHFPEKPICREPEVRKRLHLTLPYKVNVRLKNC